MKATQLLHNLGQSIWLDNITRNLLDSGTLEHYINEFCVTGLTSNPVKARIAVEEATTLGWERYVGSSGHVIGMKTFGASAPLKELQRKFGFQSDRLVVAAKELLGRG